MKSAAAAALLAILLSALPSPGDVLFQNNGTKAGWSNPNPHPQARGTITEEIAPLFSSNTSLKFEQTYDPEYSMRTMYRGGYHSELVKSGAQALGEDRYYGQAIFLPTDWLYHDTNDTFQQFSPENPSGPWALNWIQRDHMFIRVHGHQDLGPIQKGVWTRVVARFLLGNPGTFEYWVNGTKVKSLRNIDLRPSTSRTIRWSVGIYCTAWRNHTPDEPGDIFNSWVRTIYQTHHRIATTYDEAEPANWGDGSATPLGTYAIFDSNSGLALNVANSSTRHGAAVVTAQYAGSGSDQWQLSPSRDGYYVIVNVNSGLVMAVQGASTADGAPIIQWEYRATQNDEWYPVPVTDGTDSLYQLVNRKSGKYLDVAGGSATEGTQLIQNSPTGAANQQFQLIGLP